MLQLQRKLAPPLVTLLGAEPELQYVALRNIALVIQAQPGVLANDVKVFFVKVGTGLQRSCNRPGARRLQPGATSRRGALRPHDTCLPFGARSPCSTTTPPT